MKKLSHLSFDVCCNNLPMLTTELNLYWKIYLIMLCAQLKYLVRTT